MDSFRYYLQQEFMRRSSKNASYSLRAFARQLGINHATLSTLLSGKRKITKTAVIKMSKTLCMGPHEIEKFLAEPKTKDRHRSAPYFLLQNDAFSLMSDWYFDAILELSLLPKTSLRAQAISDSLGISKIQAQLALDTLERLELLKKDTKGRYRIQHSNTTTILDPDFTTAAQKKYQRAVLEKSMEALDQVPRTKRDHTSTTMAVNSRDLPQVKELIKNFRRDLNAYLQRAENKPDEVYQLQVSFFPLTNQQNNKERQ